MSPGPAVELLAPPAHRTLLYEADAVGVHHRHVPSSGTVTGGYVFQQRQDIKRNKVSASPQPTMSVGSPA